MTQGAGVPDRKQTTRVPRFARHQQGPIQRSTTTKLAEGEFALSANSPSPEHVVRNSELDVSLIPPPFSLFFRSSRGARARALSSFPRAASHQILNINRPFVLTVRFSELNVLPIRHSFLAACCYPGALHIVSTCSSSLSPLLDRDTNIEHQPPGHAPLLNVVASS